MGWVCGGTVPGIFVLVRILLLPPARRATTPTTTSPSQNMLCPFCAEPIRRQAVMWRFCGSRPGPPSASSQINLTPNSSPPHLWRACSCQLTVGGCVRGLRSAGVAFRPPPVVVAVDVVVVESPLYGVLLLFFLHRNQDHTPNQHLPAAPKTQGRPAYVDPNSDRGVQCPHHAKPIAHVPPKQPGAKQFMKRIMLAICMLTLSLMAA